MTYDEKREKLLEIADSGVSEDLGRPFDEALYSMSEMGIFDDLDVQEELAYKIVDTYLHVLRYGFDEDLRM